MLLEVAREVRRILRLDEHTTQTVTDVYKAELLLFVP
jgi:hypothetical protein